MQQVQHDNQEANTGDSMLQIQMSEITKFLKRQFDGFTITSDFRKQFNRCLSLFIFYIQAHQTKKAYTKNDLISALYKTGLGSIGDKLSQWVIEDAKQQLPVDEIKANQQMDIVEQEQQQDVRYDQVNQQQGQEQYDNYQPEQNKMEQQRQFKGQQVQ